MFNSNEVGNVRILGMTPIIFALVFLVVILSLYLGVIPDNMIGGFIIAMVLGGLLAWIGDSIPVFKDFGGAAILVLVVPAILVFLGVFPQQGVDILGNFFSGYGFVDFYIAALISGSLLGMNRTVLMKAGIRFFIPILAAVAFTFGIGALVGHLIGFGAKDAILYVIAPIMGGGVGAGIIPLSEIYSTNSGGDPADFLSMLFPAVMVANLLCIFVASILHGLGKRNKDMFVKNFSGNGDILRSGEQVKEDTSQKDKRSNQATFTNLGMGLMIAGSLYLVGYIINLVIPSIHPYAWTIILAALLKILNLVPSYVENAATDWFSFMSKEMTWALLAAGSIALINIEQLIASVTDPAYMLLTLLTVLIAAIAAGIFGLLVKFYFVESAITAGLCMADVGGTGDVAVLGATDRMHLMPFSQVSSRLGGAFILVIMSFVSSIFL